MTRVPNPDAGMHEAVRQALAVRGDEPPPGSEAAEQLELADLLGFPPNVPPAPRYPGRAPGVKNRRTVEWRDYLLARYPSPLEILAQIAAASIADLKMQFGIEADKALEHKRQAATALAPYLPQAAAARRCGG